MECRSNNNLVTLTPIHLAENKEWIKYWSYAFSNFIYIQKFGEFWINDECVYKHGKFLYHVNNNYFIETKKNKIYKFDIEIKKLVYLKDISFTCCIYQLFFFEDKYIMISRNVFELTIQRESLPLVEINFKLRGYLMGILFYNLEKVVFCVWLIDDARMRTMQYDFNSSSLTIIAEELCKAYDDCRRCDDGIWVLDNDSNLYFVKQSGNIKVFKSQRTVCKLLMKDELVGYAWDNKESIYHVQTYDGKK